MHLNGIYDTNSTKTNETTNMKYTNASPGIVLLNNLGIFQEQNIVSAFQEENNWWKVIYGINF